MKGVIRTMHYKLLFTFYIMNATFDISMYFTGTSRLYKFIISLDQQSLPL